MRWAIVLKGQLALGMLLAVQIAAGVLAFVVMIVLSRHPLVVEVEASVLSQRKKMKCFYGRGELLFRFRQRLPGAA